MATFLPAVWCGGCFHARFLVWWQLSCLVFGVVATFLPGFLVFGVVATFLPGFWWWLHSRLLFDGGYFPACFAVATFLPVFDVLPAWFWVWCVVATFLPGFWCGGCFPGPAFVMARSARSMIGHHTTHVTVLGHSPRSTHHAFRSSSLLAIKTPRPQAGYKLAT